MGAGNLREEILKHLFFSRVSLIDRPGILINRFYIGFGLLELKRRMTYFFEDPLVDLHIEIGKKIGERNSGKLFYEIGKDCGTVFAAQMFPKKLPKNIIFMFFSKILERFRFLGYTITEIIEFDKPNLRIMLRGKDNLICRKCGNGHIFAGVLAGLLSEMLKENIEAEKTRCSYDDMFCEIRIDKRIKEIYAPDKKRLVDGIADKSYDKINFPENINSIEKRVSFSEFMQFKKVLIDNYGKYYFENKSIIMTDINFPSVIGAGLVQRGYRETMEKSLVKSSEAIFRNINKNLRQEYEKTNFTLNFLSAMGWGLPYIAKSRHKNSTELKCTLLYAPRTKFGFHYFSSTLNGFINSAFNNRFRLIEIDEKDPVKTVLLFRA